MTSTLYSGLTGAGVQYFGFAEMTGYWHTRVTDFGGSHALELAGEIRYIDIGWIAPIETDPDTANGMTGDFKMGLHWISWQNETHDYNQTAVAIAGFSGFAYSFRTGVVVDVTVGIP